MPVRTITPILLVADLEGRALQKPPTANRQNRRSTSQHFWRSAVGRRGEARAKNAWS